MDDQEKSVMLAKAMGWEYRNISPEAYEFIVRGEHGSKPSPLAWHSPTGTIQRTGVPDFYEPENMHLAWEVLGWAMNFQGPWGTALSVGDFELEAWLYDSQFWGKPGAQREWLDKILDLADDAELTKVNDA